jgi:hypothetical protein
MVHTHFNYRRMGCLLQKKDHRNLFICRHKILPSGKGWKVLYGLFLICGFWATIKTKVEEKKCVALNFNKIKC